jgi:hypothetical protein
LYTWGYSAVSELRQDLFSWGRCPFDHLGWKVITLKGLLSYFGPISFVGTREVEDCRPN